MHEETEVLPSLLSAQTGTVASVYCEGKDVTAGAVTPNALVRVRYTADNGLAFAGGSYVWERVCKVPETATEVLPTPEAPTAWQGMSAEGTVACDTRANKVYYQSSDILPVWVGKGDGVRACFSDERISLNVTDAPETTTVPWNPTEIGTYKLYYDQNAAPPWEATVVLTTPVHVTTNAALDVVGTTWKLTDKSGAALSDVDGEGRFVVALDAELQVVYTVSEAGKYFKDGSTTYAVAFTASGDCEAAAMIAGQKPEKVATPCVRLGTVAQRYPWNGKIDVQYWAQYAPSGKCNLKLKVEIGGVAKEQTYEGIAAGVGTVSYDVKAAFGEVASKGCRVTVALE